MWNIKKLTSEYKKRFVNSLYSSMALVIKYVRGTIRDYSFLEYPEHLGQVKEAISCMKHNHWKQHFKILAFD